MLKIATFKYRLRPTKSQEHKMLTTLNECCWLYNYFLEDRKITYQQTGKGLSLYDQEAKLPSLKIERELLQTVYSQVLQDVAVRIDLAFKAFFRRVKNGERPGYPRFRNNRRYNSFCYPQSGYKLNGNSIKLSKIGNIRIIQHRPLFGKTKTATIQHSSTGKWFVTLTCEIDTTPIPKKTETPIGVDVGLSSFITLSTGEKVNNPRFFRRDEAIIAKAQHKINKCSEISPDRVKFQKVVARVHERISNRRHNFAHQLSRSLINHYSIIATEDIKVNRMLHNHCLAKSISDAAWSDFLRYISYKAEWAGRKYIAVNPAYTSQDCSACNHRQHISLSDRIYKCHCCGLIIDRDQNAALNILALGLQCIGNQSVKATGVLPLEE